ncbi:hypothetical protein CDL12_26309 [Handroanthus impetiginosus]|uniref:DYW domain-containing protein n=1 Tax=Handroanthus impetiginosus TaxID=429701 RepID=A0A2G9G7A7_9LAMI|nr:hypothetical protein CDL12_26309 [Handroanthus impetiginosus]
MYTRRAALVTFKPLKPLLKVCRTREPEIPGTCVPWSARNLSTATERSNFYNNFDGNIADNHAGYGNYNQNDRFYDRGLGGAEQNQNPSRVYGQYGNAQNHLDYSSGNQNSRFYGRNLDGVELNRNSNPLYGQNFDVRHGEFASGNVGYGPKNVFEQSANFNGSGIQQQNPRGHFAGQNNFAHQSVYNVEMHMQDGSNVESVEVAEGSYQYRSKLEDLDEFAKEGKLKEAVELLGEVQKEGLQVELPRYMALMKACGDNEALDEAKLVHDHLMKSMPNLEVRTYNMILEMYLKCGSMVDAFAVFDQMPQRNLTSWDIMISGLAKNKLGEDAVELFAEFKRSGLKPDGQMFIGVFSACGVVCDIVEGMLHFESMVKDYGIVPTMEHYVSIVDMMGNAGCLDEALEFIEKMPVKPSIDIYETLMKFSRIHGNTELGERCAELIELLDPSRLNEQSKAGLIPINASDLAKEKEKKKLSGQNLLDVRSRVHEYRAGDRSHPDHERIYTLLRGLKQQMKEVGYVPETKFVLHDVDQEVKEEALMAHSERLAAAQGFLTSAVRSPLRIIKNLRVCGDCHNAFKIISKIVGREIIARDSKRFHHFRDGSCSCNDYW